MNVQINGCTYRLARPMSAMVQWDMMSRISPLLASGFGELVPLFIEMRELGINNIAEMDIKRLAAIATPVARELSHISDSDRHWIFSTCLACVDRRKDGETGGWAAIWNRDANVAMFDDINKDAFLMGRITLGVLQETFEAFFPASLLSSIKGAKT